MKFLRYRKVIEEFKRFEYLSKLPDLRSNIHFRYIALTLFSFLVAGILVHYFWKSELPKEAVWMIGIFALAALLWMTEALPLFATAFVIIILEVVLLANPGNWVNLGFEDGKTIPYQEFLQPLSDPIIFLFLGGFLLAQASVKEGIDKALASNILRFFGTRPQIVMLGMMIITCIFSMWMSNTATTAMMITLTIPLLSQIDPTDPFRKGLILSVPFAANIGGLGTPIASPPNAVAVSFLRNSGIAISFFNWMLLAIPLMVVILLITWQLLWRLFRPVQPAIQLRVTSHKIDGRGFYVMIVFITTIALWLTDSWHGLPTSVVAFVPIVAFTTTGIIRRSDINSLEWHILILIAGGIALGFGMKTTGLDMILVELLPKSSASLFTMLIVATILLSTFMSNTAASNLLIPLGVSMATALESSRLSIEIGIGIAFAASMAMALPISTPPNAIAYSQGTLTSKDFVKPGVIIALLAIIFILILKYIMHYFIK